MSYVIYSGLKNLSCHMGRQLHRSGFYLTKIIDKRNTPSFYSLQANE